MPVTHDFRGSNGGDDTRECAVLVATEGRRDFNRLGGCVDNLFSSPLGSGVTVSGGGEVHQVGHMQKQRGYNSCHKIAVYDTYSHVPS